MKQLRGYSKSQADRIPDAVKDNPQFLDAVQKYGSLSEDALMDRLLEQIRVSREQGAYNPAQTESYISMLAPYLNSAQREKLQNVIRIIEHENG